MTAILLAMKLIVRLGPHATGQTLLSKKMEGVPEALESLSITAKSLPVIANLGEQARSHLGSGARQGTEQIMIGMKSEKLLDAPSIEAKLLFDRKKHLYQTQSQEALGFHIRCGASKFGSVSERSPSVEAPRRYPRADGCAGSSATCACRLAPAKLISAKLGPLYSFLRKPQDYRYL